MAFYSEYKCAYYSSLLQTLLNMGVTFYLEVGRDGRRGEGRVWCRYLGVGMGGKEGGRGMRREGMEERGDEVDISRLYYNTTWYFCV